MLTLKQGIKLSAIIDKIDIDVSKLVEALRGEMGGKSQGKKDQEEGFDSKTARMKLGLELLMQIVRKAHKAEQEIYDFVASAKDCTPEEAEKINPIAFFKELFSDSSVTDFFTDALASDDKDTKQPQKS